MEMDAEDAARIGISTYPGWFGAFCRHQVPGAIGNGERVIKVKREHDDRQPIGTRGTVLGSIKPHGLPRIGYFIEWDTMRRCAVFVVDWKIERL